MSVIMTMRMKADPKRLEEVASANPDQLTSILELGKTHGLIAHRFYGSDDGQVMVIDEWPEPQSFQSFFDEAGDQIRGVMADVGVSSEPEVNFWRKIDSPDEFGWGA